MRNCVCIPNRLEDLLGNNWSSVHFLPCLNLSDGHMFEVRVCFQTYASTMSRELTDIYRDRAGLKVSERLWMSVIVLDIGMRKVITHQSRPRQQHGALLNVYNFCLKLLIYVTAQVAWVVLRLRKIPHKNGNEGALLDPQDYPKSGLRKSGRQGFGQEPSWVPWVSPLGPKFWVQKFSHTIPWWCVIMNFLDLLAKIWGLFSDSGDFWLINSHFHKNVSWITK